MKTFLLTTGSLCAAIVALLLYSNFRNAPAPAAIAPVSADNTPPPATIPAAKISPASTTTPDTNHPFHHSNAPHVPDATAIASLSPFRSAIATLVSRQSTFQEKQAAWKQLHESGQFDDALEALKQGAKDNPDSPEYAAMLGQGYLQKAGEVSKNGGSVNELGILGMSADQSFDNALKIDPANWDAQFFKAVAMSYWPAELNKGDEVVQRLSSLIDQQQNLPTEPQFASTYAILGAQYQKLGQTDNALQTWQAGAAKFPNDPTLQQKLSAAAAH